MPEWEMEIDGRDLFIVFDGVRIAKRGQPGTSHARQWVSLKPGYVVLDNADKTAISVKFNGARLQ
jgi:hypothetical protein